MSQSSPPRYYIDPWLFWPALLLVLTGILMVASASMVISDRQYGYPFYYLIRHVIYVCLAAGLCALCCQLPLPFWRRTSRYLLLIAALLLLVVLIPGIGRMVNGSRRWLHLGPLTLQVSELAKLAFIIYLADYLTRCHREVIEQLSGFVRPLCVLSVFGLLLLGEPDFGAVTVITCVCLGLLFLAGVRLWPFGLMFAGVILVLGLLAWTSPYRLARLTSFLNPWLHPFGSGYQLTQSLIAFGRGGFWGVGLGNSIQKLFYLPEAHTDFVYAVLAEELGLWGQLLVISLFGMLVGRGLILARRLSPHDLFASYVSYGLSLWIALQAMINIGVNTGLLPTKGLTLPFISYGGSSLLVNGLVLGVLLRVAHRSRFYRQHSVRYQPKKVHEAWS